jgi:hypothetical protein
VRLPRIFGKKRGHRRTGSQVWGTVIDAVFHAALLSTGVIFGGLLVSGVAVPEWRINHDFLPTRCTVVGKRIERRVADRPPGAWHPALLVRYEADGASRTAWAWPAPVAAATDRAAAIRRLEAWRLGDELPGWFDPSAPGAVVLQRGYNWWMWLLALLLPGALVAFGGAGLLRAYGRWGKSEEHHAAAAVRGPRVDPLSEAVVGGPGHPAIPSCDDLVNSPGTILRYRLPIDSPENWTLLGFGLFAMLWNAILAVFAVQAGIDLIGGRWDWLLGALLLTFAAVGVAAVVVFVRRLVLATAVGPTQVEIADHPLLPGGEYDVLLAQAGTVPFQELAMSLEMEERATFRQGTDTRSERAVVWRQPIHAWRDVTLAPGTRFEARARVRVPPAAMHSFASEHNSVRWMIVVHGAPARWPAFRRVFPVVVFPPAPGAEEPAA